MIRARRVLALALLVSLGALTAAMVSPTAVPAAVDPAVADCNAHGRLSGHYTAAQLRSGLTTMPADVKEYTDCFDVIQRALTAQLSGAHIKGAGADSGSGGSFLPVPVLIVLGVLLLTAASYALAAARRRGKRPGEASG
ncbi:MAG: hypothetical protein M3Z27_03045, partial [Actinomycetota bacterium]|nr:hypothetical protein [Actinomycetota bacterium]